MKQQYRHGYKVNYDENDELAEFIIKQKPYINIMELKPHQVWLDAGANLGVFAIDISNFVKEIHCFEPVKETCRILDLNLLENCMENVIPYNSGLWTKKRGEADLWKHDRSRANDTLYFNKDRAYSTDPIKVKMENYAEIIKNLNVNCVKIDTEGGEVEFVDDLTSRPRILEHLVMEYHQRQYNDWDLKTFQHMRKALMAHFDDVECDPIHHYCITIKCS